MAKDPLERIELVVGDITRVEADGLVNAANKSLAGGGGVDGAIHRAAGPALKAHGQELGGCETGLAVTTPAFGLSERGVRRLIHAVAPRWRGDPEAPLGENREDILLASCYQRALELAAESGVRTLAFPALGTGAYRFPPERAAKIAFSHVRDWLARHDTPARVLFVCYREADRDVYRRVIETRDQWMQ